MACARAAISRVAAEALRQSSVASTSPRLTIAPGRTSTVPTYAETYCGPTRAAFHAAVVPMYVRVGRNVVALHFSTVTRLADDASATWLVRDAARRYMPTSATS